MRTRRLPREEEATLVEHLDELRQRIIVTLATVGVTTAAAFVVHNQILDLLTRALPAGHRQLVTFGVAEPLSVSITVSIYAGLVLALPLILWQAWSFLVPALDAAAARKILAYAAFGMVLAGVGLAFGYSLLLPRALHFLTSYDTENFRIMIRATNYFSFVTAILLGVVCVFETPLVILAAVNLGLLTSTTLRRNRRKGYFIVAAIALALPGPDPVTTMLELLPMWILFEGSIWLAVLTERRAARLGVAGAAA
ncbi:MAG TPA: twin-arginine translocase subunit TatC [Gaiellaceae bacterium]|jgi:sec-independent protein translocase protein TatC